MADRLSTEYRSWNMSRIRGKDTKPELLVRSLIHRMGYRFRLHVAGLPGKPDVVLPRLRTVIFVHGCFWHRHAGCPKAYTPKSRTEFWQRKFDCNVERDQAAVDALSAMEWRVLTVWECELADISRLRRRLRAALRRAEESVATREP
ncbi:MAG: very short patch repair endonuclease [Phycisphaerales bacterium]